MSCSIRPLSELLGISILQTTEKRPQTYNKTKLNSQPVSKTEPEYIMAQSPLVRVPAEILEKILAQLIENRSATSIVISRLTDNGRSAWPRFRAYACDGRVLDQLVEVHREYVDFDHDGRRDDVALERHEGYSSLLAVAQTCSALHAEAVRLLYSKPVLQFLHLEDMRDFLTGLRPYCARLVRSVRVSLPIYPPVPQQHAPHNDTDAWVALQYMRTILPLAPGLVKLTVATHVLDHSWSDDEDAFDEVELLVENHRDAFALAKDAIRDEDGRDFEVDHDIVVAGDVDSMLVD